MSTSENREVSFNLVQDLNILFVDVDNRDGRRRFLAVEKFFQADTILWDFVHDYLPLKEMPESIDALNVYDVLRANNMGYTHIVVDGKRWEQFTEKEQSRLVNNFKQNVRKLMPQLLVVLGRKTYEALFKKEQPKIRGTMPVGFRPHNIQWKVKDANKKKGSTKIFLMRKTRFKTSKDAKKAGKLLASSFKQLNEFREKHGGNIGKRKRGEFNADMSTYMDSYLEPYFDAGNVSRMRPSKMMKQVTGPAYDEEDELSPSTASNSSGTEAD